MTLGSRIRDFRRKAGMTQRELGIAVGFSPLTADVRIAAGSRRPESSATLPPSLESQPLR